MTSFLCKISHIKNLPTLWPHFWPLIFSAVVAVCLQLQITIGESDTYLGLRLTLADALLPLAGLFILFHLVKKEGLWPRWALRRADWWLAALTVLFLVSFVQGYLVTGDWIRWAFVNRIVGWFVLLGYIYMAGWAVTNFGEAILRVFLVGAAGFLAVLQASGFLMILLQDLSVLPHPFGPIFYPLAMFMVNRNAYIFFVLAVMTGFSYFFFSLPYHSQPIEPRSRRFYSILCWALWGMAPLLVVFNGSRAGIGCLIVLGVCLLLSFGRSALRVLGPCLVLGTLLSVAYVQIVHPYSFLAEQNEKLGDTAKLLHNMTPEQAEMAGVHYKGDQIRLKATEQALHMWAEHPIMGGGLGSFFHYQNGQPLNEQKVELLDNTPLWLLSETGSVGLTLFSLMFLLSLSCFWKNRALWSHQAGFVLLLLFGAMSLFHQLLFIRIFWVLLAGFLALPATPPSQQKN